MSDLQLRLITALSAILAGVLLKWAAILTAALGLLPGVVSPEAINLLATAIVSGGVGWAVKHWTDWGVPKDPPPPTIEHELKR